MSSSSSSISSSSSSSRSSSPEPQPKSKALKRKHQEREAQSSSDSSDHSDDSSSESEEEPVNKKNSKLIPTEDEKPDDGEPVLSHAERRRQKRLSKQKAAEANDSEGILKKRKLDDGSATTAKDSKSNGDRTKARQNSVWVGNMSFKTAQDDLKRFFADCGEITRINMPTKPRLRPNVPVENRGFAYVDFATPEAKTIAIALSEQPLVGRKLLIKDGDNFEGRPAAPGADIKTADPSLAHRIHSKTAQKILRQQKQPPAPTLFIGNLPFETTEDGLKELFEKHHEQETKRGAGKDSKKGKMEDVEEEESDGENTDNRGGGEKTQDKGKGKASSKKDDFILRVRMGTFEDSGACKGFAFIDFSSVDNATSALINIRNHLFNGRELKVEYAGIDAVRRGPAKHLVPAASGAKGGKDRGEGGKSFKPRGPKPSKPAYDTERNMEVDEPAPAPAPREDKPSWNDRPKKRVLNDTRKVPRARPTPGAALALAKRETAAIVPGQGKKTTF
ncbi:RNA-binding domain-containing protein [Coprinellus micaceus]|uniref:RNA-binding domain-containing protein n=1 Tax=Coprinellus micaceus TaxID=71717 RepID=A0A4Y7TTD2_COPMI|nr:RNA-binding domain-containing protein [Coprinellus micaceus]